jgi:hypothetical protein
MPFPVPPIAAVKTNATVQQNDHPEHHNLLAAGVNDLNAELVSRQRWFVQARRYTENVNVAAATAARPPVYWTGVIPMTGTCRLTMNLMVRNNEGSTRSLTTAGVIARGYADYQGFEWIAPAAPTTGQVPVQLNPATWVHIPSVSIAAPCTAGGTLPFDVYLLSANAVSLTIGYLYTAEFWPNPIDNAA